jgi:hypothetical protein
VDGLMEDKMYIIDKLSNKVYNLKQSITLLLKKEFSMTVLYCVTLTKHWETILKQHEKNYLLSNKTTEDYRISFAGAIDKIMIYDAAGTGTKQMWIAKIW